MRRVVRLTDAAIRELRRVRRYLTQPGAGDRGHERAQRIIAAIAALADEADRFPSDPFRPGRRNRIVEGHVVSFTIVVRPDGGEDVSVERVYGPGQRRP